MKTLLSITIALALSTVATAEPLPAIVALEAEILRVGNTGLRVVSVRWHDAEQRRIESEGGEHYIKMPTEGAGYYEGQKIALYVRHNGTTEWDGRTFKRWDAVVTQTLPKGTRLPPFPSEFDPK